MSVEGHRDLVETFTTVTEVGRNTCRKGTLGKVSKRVLNQGWGKGSPSKKDQSQWTKRSMGTSWYQTFIIYLIRSLLSTKFNVRQDSSHYFSTRKGDPRFDICI